MLRRQRTGSVVCPSCGKLVGINDERCYGCGRPRPGMWGFAPLLRRFGQDLGFVEIVTWGAALLYLGTLLFDPSGVGMRGFLGILSPSGESLFVFGASGPAPVFGYGRWWSVLSAGWLHGGLIHILFNVYWVRYLGPPVAELYGPARLVILYTVGSVAGFVVSSLSTFAPGILRLVMGGGGGITVGASAAIFGLLGALVHYGRRVSSAVGRMAWTYALFFFVFGLVMRGIDNWAHLGGFAGGYLASHFLDPLKPERGDHVVAAVACLVLSAVAIVASVVTGIALLR